MSDMSRDSIAEIPGPETNLADFLLFAAAEVPNKVCVETEGSCYTYAQMARMVGYVRSVLRRALDRCEEVVEAAASTDEEEPLLHRRRRDEHVVCIVLDRGYECLAAVHAAMLERCVYNTFDAAEPREKLKTWVEIAEHPVMITSRPVMDRLGLTERGWKFGGDYPRFVLDIHEVLHKSMEKVDMTLPAPAQRESDLERLCYVIFTSGSTGKPKAVMIQHRSACNLVRVWSDFVGLQCEDRIAQMASMAFDNHVPEVYGAMRKRCTSVVVPDLTKRSGPDMLGWLQSKRINLMVTVPSHLRSMSGPGADVSTDALPQLRVLDIGGEALGRDVLDSWAPGRKLFNIYGPTEMTVVCAGVRVEPGDEITIGYDLPTYKNYVLDPESLQACAVGTRGVLYTGGVGTARGYLDDEEKTSGKFVQVPGLGRLYCSGDVVSQDTRGRFHYHGRADWQVKVRGIRIELEALEEAIGNVDGVKHCEARVVDGGQKLALIASGNGLAEGPIKEAAAKLGKGYQLNLVKIVEHSAWKFNTSGKLVRNHVPLVEEKSEGASGPRNGWDSFNQEGTSELEREIASCVAQLVTAESWGTESHFIEDLGLDSAGFGKLITLLRRKPALRSVDLPTLFEHPTVQGLACMVESQHEEDEAGESDDEAAPESEAPRLEDLLLGRCDPAAASDGQEHGLCVEEVGGSRSFAQLRKMALAVQVRLRRAIGDTGAQSSREQGGVVVLVLEAGADLLAVMVAASLERHAFCILDPQAPASELVEQIALVGACAVVVDASRAAELGELHSDLQEPCAVLNISSMTSLLSKPPPSVRRPRRAGQICCVAVTVDAAGQYKALQLEHAALHWAAQAWQRHMAIQPEDRVVQMVPHNTVPGVVGLWACIAAGAALVFPPAGMAPGAGLRTYLKTRHATSLGATPWQLRTLGMEGASALSSLRLVWAVGTPIQADLVSRWCMGRRFVQAYSRAEVAAACVFDLAIGTSVAPGQLLPFGHALPGSQLHVLNEFLEPVGEGEHGSLFMGGPGVASGSSGLGEQEQGAFVQVEGLGRLFRTKEAAQLAPGGLVVPIRGRAKFSKTFSTDESLQATPCRQPMARRATSSFMSFRRYIIQTFHDVDEAKEDPYGEEAWVILCFVVQSGFIVIELLYSVLAVVVFERFLMPYTLYGDYWVGIVLIIVAQLLQQLANVLQVLLLKWTLIGRYREGDYAIYSIYYLKHWIVDRAASRTVLGTGSAQGGWNFLLGRNFLKVMLLRALGADVHLSAQVTAQVAGFDLISIGPLASVHGPHHLTAVSFSGKRMIVGRQTIGRGATVCHGSSIAAGAVVLGDAFVEPLSAVPAGSQVEGRWSGVPARRVGPSRCAAQRCYNNGAQGNEDCVSEGTDVTSIMGGECAERRLTLAGFVFTLGSLLLVPVNLLTLIAGLYLTRLLVEEADGSQWSENQSEDVLPPLIMDHMQILLVFGLAYTVFNELLTLATPVLVCRLLPKVRAGLDVPIYHWRAQLAALKLNLASKASEELGDASVQAAYLRLCGAKIGRGSSMSEQTVLPELLEVGEDCFFASGNTLLNVQVDQGRMRIPTKTVISDNAFLGNENHIAEGIPSETFVGLRTWVPMRLADGGSLFGNPAMRFGRPAAAPGAKDAPFLQKVWHHFSTSFLDVFFWKALFSLATSTAFTVGRTLYPEYQDWQHGIYNFIVELVIFAGMRLGAWFLVSVFFCNLIYNDRLPLSAPFYSTVITRWFSANKIRKVFRKPIRTSGTGFDAMFMRFIGVKVGKRFFSPNEDVMIDPPFGRLGDDVTVDYDGQIRQHSFEDDVLKWGPNYIGDGTTILQAGMVAMSDCAERVLLLRGSVTWKGQVLEPDAVYEGAPAAPVLPDLELNANDNRVAPQRVSQVNAAA
eukprot:CAMPEP_0195058934 /NCGR_PEP_ID=MMETSP0448-20130528/6557_1 /TAXON_ID=66468 /ORGANISM="Heterocapsa triquestra, Strain CCMP 448" /LENGTH=1886 /DNA_ID=CAMNT_0040089121 /DNA_START=107 /DNA_END=5767 /DNA_ORIENTATION=-